MPQQQGYLSTDPNAGQPVGQSGYLSTDPNAGQSGEKASKVAASPSHASEPPDRVKQAMESLGYTHEKVKALGAMMLAGEAGAGIAAASKLLPMGLRTIGNLTGQTALGAGQAAATGSDPAAGAALGGGLSAIGAGASALAPPIMRGAHRITASLGRKYPELAQAALKYRIMPTAAGAEKAAGLRNAEMAAQDAAVASHDPRMSIPTAGMVTQTSAELQPSIRARQLSGDLTAAVPQRVTDFGTQKGLAPSELQSARRVWNEDLGRAPQAVQTGQSMDLEEKALKSLAHQSGDTLETLVPGYKDRNRTISTFEGLRQSASGAAAMPATGMDDLFAGYGIAANPANTPAIAAMRVLKSRPVRAGVAIASHETGKVLSNPSVRAALLAALLQPSHSQK